VAAQHLVIFEELRPKQCASSGITTPDRQKTFKLLTKENNDSQNTPFFAKSRPIVNSTFE